MLWHRPRRVRISDMECSTERCIGKSTRRIAPGSAASEKGETRLEGSIPLGMAGQLGRAGSAEIPGLRVDRDAGPVADMRRSVSDGLLEPSTCAVSSSIRRVNGLGPDEFGHVPQSDIRVKADCGESLTVG